MSVPSGIQNIVENEIQQALNKATKRIQLIYGMSVERVEFDWQGDDVQVTSMLVKTDV